MHYKTAVNIISRPATIRVPRLITAIEAATAAVIAISQTLTCSIDHIAAYERLFRA